MDRNKISILENIGKIITESARPHRTLEKIVELVADKFNIDVCSVYLLDTDKRSLVLQATVGLRKESTGKIRMSVHEGLTGFVLEEMRPVFIVNPAAHPRYKFFEKSGEEIYSTYLGVPLVHLRNPLGVLVVQTVQEDAISKSDMNLFATIASQISATVAYSGLLEDLKKERQDRRDLEERLLEEVEIHAEKTAKKGKKGLIRGMPVSPGFAEGHAHYLGESIGFDQIEYEETEDVSSEISRLEAAFTRSQEEIIALTKHVKDMSGEDEAILDAQVMALQDRSFKKKIIAHIKEGSCAEYALKKAILKYVEFFSNMEDPYLKERGSDIEDIGKRVLRKLLGYEGRETRQFTRETVVIASDISPIDLIGLRQDNLKGIVLSRGGKTSHAVILAKSFEIPMVIGVRDMLDTVKENDFLIVDGTSGIVFSKPPQVIIDEYTRLKAEKVNKFQQLDVLRDLEAKTKDGYEIKLGANIGLLSDLELVKKYGGDHIGLYRTEFPFLVRKEFPSENEQFLLYKKVVEGAEGRSVTIRTLDVGGDKFLSYLDYPKEQNPYLGWRSIRVSLELDDIFRTQIRAILKASAFGHIKILFPMITSAGEVRRIVSLLDEEKSSLEERGIPFDTTINIGIMVEVPGTVKILDRLLHYVDFVSIGTNDLIQYTLAVDRNNQKVAELYDPLHPAVISTILDVVSICKKNNKEVSICGEAASNPRCAYLFTAFETDKLSMNPASIPVIKDLIRKVRLTDTKKALNSVLLMEDSRDITSYLDKILPSAQ
ncbi:MAG: phosphoenolpyruvate--protein phosphotransferase [Desulfobacteraceae bacterium]|nr:phosphoenolpyruvate--protein phosphotransferase [Desulfobacteraceae bacterium]MBC2719524.1 phosphoenolpyruvate--protein phosphotransferase [Desulfobacteraceae bacterium]